MVSDMATDLYSKDVRAFIAMTKRSGNKIAKEHFGISHTKFHDALRSDDPLPPMWDYALTALWFESDWDMEPLHPRMSGLEHLFAVALIYAFPPWSMLLPKIQKKHGGDVALTAEAALREIASLQLAG